MLEDTVRRTYNTADSFGPLDTLHGILGLVGEVGELVDTIKKHQFYGLPLDKENILEELGDALYYLEALRICYDMTWEEIIPNLRDKLQKRYPSGFTKDDAVARKDKAEKSPPVVDRTPPGTSGKKYWNDPDRDGVLGCDHPYEDVED